MEGTSTIAKIAIPGLAIAVALPLQAHGNPAAPPCAHTDYRYVFVHVTHRAPGAPPPEGKGDERIRIGYQRPEHGQNPARLPLCSFVHEQQGRFSSSVPVEGAWLEPDGRIRLRSSVVHGDAIDIDVRPNPRSLTITRHADGRLMQMGTYRVSSKPFTLK